jgi:DNA-binding response OmpR family regulator
MVMAMRILIVEDDQRLADIFRDFIGELGYQPIVVGSAEAALDALAVARPDTILLDLRLPGMNGGEFLSLPVVRDSEVPVVVISGVATEAEARACLKLGALDFIRKPVTLERLEQVLSYLTPFAMARRQASQRQVVERRPAPRAAVKLGVRITASKGALDGTCTELSSTGMRVRVSQRLRPGQAVKLAFAPPDGGPPIDVVSLVVRVDAEGAAFWFLDLQSHEATRLNAFVERLLGQASR